MEEKPYKEMGKGILLCITILSGKGELIPMFDDILYASLSIPASLCSSIHHIGEKTSQDGYF